jgi:ABC-type ATPase involved in cell division
MIHLYRVSKIFEGIPALREITVSVDKGEFVFVVPAAPERPRS